MLYFLYNFFNYNNENDNLIDSENISQDEEHIDKWINKNLLKTAQNSKKVIKYESLNLRSQFSVFDKNMISRLMVGKYKNTYLDHILMKDAISLHLYEMVIQKIKPATIIELGTAAGGSALWFASKLKGFNMTNSKVVSIDILDRKTNDTKKKIEEFNSINCYIADINNKEKIYSILKDYPHPWLISEDCHVDADIIMNTFDNIIENGDYIVFEDTHPNNPDTSWMDAEDMQNYKCDYWSQDKLNKVEKAMLKRDDSYAIDCNIQDMYGYNGCTFINSVFKKI